MAGPKEAHCRGSVSQPEAASVGEGFMPPQLPSSRGCGDTSDGLLTRGHVQASVSKMSAEKNESRSAGGGPGPFTVSTADGRHSYASRRRSVITLTGLQVKQAQLGERTTRPSPPTRTSWDSPNLTWGYVSKAGATLAP